MNRSVAAPVSVVIPAHNAANFIRDAIQSVHAQTLPVKEVIVVIDDCADDTESIATGLGARIVALKEKRNIPAARNLGIRSATEEWIAWLDADDCWERNKMAAQWRAKEAFPEAAVISCDIYSVFEGRISRLRDDDLLERKRNVSCRVVRTSQGTYFPEVDGAVLRWFPFATPTVLMRREVVDRTGFFDETLLHDSEVEFFARTLKCHSLVVVEEALVCRRLRVDSHSTNVEGDWEAYISIVDMMLRHPDQYPPRAGRERREHLKQMFLSHERLLSDRRKKLRP
jgi:glycosyltransferase involved in cell wall biosynthesis